MEAKQNDGKKVLDLAITKINMKDDLCCVEIDDKSVWPFVVYMSTS